MSELRVEDDERRMLAYALRVQESAWLAHDAVELENANNLLLTMVPRAVVVAVVPDEPPHLEHEVRAALKHQDRAYTSRHQRTIQKANEYLLDAVQQFESSSPDKR